MKSKPDLNLEASQVHKIWHLRSIVLGKHYPTLWICPGESGPSPWEIELIKWPPGGNNPNSTILMVPPQEQYS